jgi:hypothetical protein
VFSVCFVSLLLDICVNGFSCMFGFCVCDSGFSYIYLCCIHFSVVCFIVLFPFVLISILLDMCVMDSVDI